jgi:hypothetical protein
MSRPGYKLNSAGTRYAYTLAGAMRTAVDHQWPIAPIRRWSALLSARKPLLQRGAERGDLLSSTYELPHREASCMTFDTATHVSARSFSDRVG